MADGPNKRDVQNSKDLKDELLGARDFARDLANSIKSSYDGSKIAADLAKRIKEEMSGQVDISDRLNTLIEARDGYLKDQLSNGKILNKNLIKELDTQIEILSNAELLTKEKEHQKDLEQEYQDVLKGVNNELYSGLGLLGDWLQAGTSIEMASIALKGTIDAIGSSFESTLGTVISLRRELGLSADAASALTVTSFEAQLSMKGLRFSTEELQHATRAYVEDFGTAKGLTSDLVRNITDIGKLTGDIEGATSLANIFQHANHHGEELTANIKRLAEKEGVAASNVFKDMSHFSSLLVGASEEQIKNFAKQNIELQKQGLTMSNLSDIADNMLDVETSLRNQAKARALLQGRISQDQFNAMNVIRNQALLYQQGAMNVEEFGNSIKDSLVSQKQFNELGPRGQKVYAESLGVNVDLIREMLETQAAHNEEIKNSGILSTTMGAASSFWESTPDFIKNATSALAGYIVQSMILTKLQTGKSGLGNLFGGKGGGVSSAAGKGGGGSMMGGMTKSIQQINPKKLLAGGAALALVAASVFIFAKAAQEFMQVSWEAVGMAVVSMLALVGAVALLGAIMMSGVGTVAILAGAAAMLVIASSVFVLGAALQQMVPFMAVFNTTLDTLGNVLTNLSTDNILPILALGPALFGVAAGLLAVGSAGLISIPGVAALATMSSIAPTLLGLGDSFGRNNDTTEVSDNDIDKKMLEEIQGLRKDIQLQPIILNVDGKIVSKISKVQSRQGINAKGFK